MRVNWTKLMACFTNQLAQCIFFSEQILEIKLRTRVHYRTNVILDISPFNLTLKNYSHGKQEISRINVQQEMKRQTVRIFLYIITPAQRASKTISRVYMWSVLKTFEFHSYWTVLGCSFLIDGKTSAMWNDHRVLTGDIQRFSLTI